MCLTNILTDNRNYLRNIVFDGLHSAFYLLIAHKYLIFSKKYFTLEERNPN